jgi:beta-N-acetylhexosaminidase
MVGHVRVPALDAGQPVSVSHKAVSGLLRDRWGYDGLVVTDDMCMGAIFNRAEGIGGAAVRALNAGVDLLLVSWDGEQLYPVLAALLQASRAGALDGAMTERSAARLKAARP